MKSTSNTLTVAHKLVELCQQGKNMEALNTLYDENIVSVEALSPPGAPTEARTSKGLDAVRKKSEWWYNAHETHGASVKGPFPHGEDRFACIFNFDVTNKESGQRIKMEEVAVYTVANDKIVKEEFFYSMG